MADRRKDGMRIFILFASAKPMRGSRTLCQRGSNFDKFFFSFFFLFWVNEGREDPNATIRRAIIGLKWRFAGVNNSSTLMNAGFKDLLFSGEPDQYC